MCYNGSMRTGSALLHRWSAALEEYDFTVKHRPGKSQTHVDGLSRLPVDPPPPGNPLLQVRLLEDEDEARKIARELHTATHLGGHALWQLFRDRYSHIVQSIMASFSRNRYTPDKSTKIGREFLMDV